MQCPWEAMRVWVYGISGGVQRAHGGFVAYLQSVESMRFHGGSWAYSQCFGHVASTCNTLGFSFAFFMDLCSLGSFLHADTELMIGDRPPLTHPAPTPNADTSWWSRCTMDRRRNWATAQGGESIAASQTRGWEGMSREWLPNAFPPVLFYDQREVYHTCPTRPKFALESFRLGFFPSFVIPTQIPSPQIHKAWPFS